MDIGIAVFRQQPAVRLERIMDVYFGLLAVTPDSALYAIRVRENDNEIVDAHQSALHLGSRRRRDCHGYRRNVDRRCTAATSAPSPATRHDPRLLQLPFIGKLAGESLEVARDRMTGSTGRFEIRFAG